MTKQDFKLALKLILTSRSQYYTQALNKATQRRLKQLDTIAQKSVKPKKA